jgi:hypothetical protein
MMGRVGMRVYGRLGDDSTQERASPTLVIKSVDVYRLGRRGLTNAKVYRLH